MRLFHVGISRFAASSPPLAGKKPEKKGF